MSGDRVVLPCPIKPGVLIQQYSVSWAKGSTTIAIASGPQSVQIDDGSRYKIDRATYSLIVDPVNTSDTSDRYRCKLSVTNPLTNSKHVLKPSNEVSLSIIVTGKCLYACSSNIVLAYSYYYIY